MLNNEKQGTGTPKHPSSLHCAGVVRGTGTPNHPSSSHCVRVVAHCCSQCTTCTVARYGVKGSAVPDTPRLYVATSLEEVGWLYIKKSKYTKYINMKVYNYTIYRNIKIQNPKITNFTKLTKYELWNLYIIQNKNVSF